MSIDYLEAIRTSRVYDVAQLTPLEHARRLSRRLGQHVMLKREDLQPVFSFKLRGAYNRLVNLSAEQRASGVICSSAGNHGQGIALAGSELNIRTVIVMPLTTPRIKSEAVQMLGGEIVLHGNTYDDAYQHAIELAQREKLVFVHPFDDPLVIAGQGTIGQEILQQYPGDIHAVFVPVGGGGLAAGIGAYIKAMNPAIRVIGVEAEDSAGMYAARCAGHPVTLDSVGLFADGVAVRRVGDESFRLCQQYVDDIIRVDTDEICAAIQDVYDDTRTVVEPAGALAVAGLKKFAEQMQKPEQVLVAINSGANMNFYRLRHIAERAAIGENREALMAVEIPEQTGSFLRFCESIGRRHVTEFNYRYNNPQRAKIFVGIELQRGNNEAVGLMTDLKAAGYPVIDLSRNELAKLHVRHMIGGIASELADERLLRVQFPERPGALLDFLRAIGTRWNISMFHYRNHGSDYGRVLVGVQVSAADQQDFNQHLDDLAYPYQDETDNPAFGIFLAGNWPTG